MIFFHWACNRGFWDSISIGSTPVSPLKCCLSTLLTRFWDRSFKSMWICELDMFPFFFRNVWPTPSSSHTWGMLQKQPSMYRIDAPILFNQIQAILTGISFIPIFNPDRNSLYCLQTLILYHKALAMKERVVYLKKSLILAKIYSKWNQYQDINFGYWL